MIDMNRETLRSMNNYNFTVQDEDVVGVADASGVYTLLPTYRFLDDWCGVDEDKREWLRHPERRHYQSVVYTPGVKDVGPETFNLWDPPYAGEDDGSFLKQIRGAVRDWDYDKFESVLDWLADAFQRPAEWNGTGLALSGNPEWLVEQLHYMWYGAMCFTENTSKVDPYHQFAAIDVTRSHGNPVAMKELRRLVDTQELNQRRYSGPNYLRTVAWVKGEWTPPSGFLHLKLDSMPEKVQSRHGLTGMLLKRELRKEKAA
jgi:hypothetical protein